MDLNAVISEVETWPPEERYRLIEALWEGLSGENPEFELSHELKELLDSRLAALDANPGNVVTWDEIKAHARRPR